MNLSQARPKVIAAIPCLNTEASIGDVVSRAKKYVDQVIVVDDGSTDGTAKVAKAAGALVISHGINKGQGAATKTYFRVAKAKNAQVLVTLDGDNQHNPDEIPLVITPILRGQADLVIGSRFLTNDSNIPRYRKFGIRVITFLYNFGSRTKVLDTQSGFRAYSKQTVEALHITEAGMGYSIETLVKARRKGFSIEEVPISCLYFQSNLNTKVIKHGLGVALSVVRTRYRSLLSKFIRDGDA